MIESSQYNVLHPIFTNTHFLPPMFSVSYHSLPTTCVFARLFPISLFPSLYKLCLAIELLMWYHAYYLIYSQLLVLVQSIALLPFCPNCTPHILCSKLSILNQSSWLSSIYIMKSYNLMLHEWAMKSIKLSEMNQRGKYIE